MTTATVTTTGARQCRDCSAPITARSTTGRCRTCSGRINIARARAAEDPAVRAANLAKARAAITPGQRREWGRKGLAAMDPAARARGLAAARTPAARAKAAAAIRTHGLSKTPEYSSWSAMVHRCTNPKDPSYDAYGGRGITVDPAWLASVEQFVADMGPRPEGMSLDRLDPNGNYGPGLCRWADAKTQRANQRPRARAA